MTDTEGPAGKPRARGAKLLVTAVLLLAATIAAVYNTTFADFTDSIARFSASGLVLIVCGILIAFLVAAFRLKLIAADFGYPLTFFQSVATVSVGQVGGFLFFQLIGQLVARGAYLARHNISMTGTVLITGTERIGAALVSIALAVSGAIYIFSGITLQINLSPIRLILGLSFVLLISGYMWRHALLTAWRAITFSDVKKLLRSLAVSILVQLPMMGAYITAAHAIAPQIPLLDLAAASTLVMFAASIPISFAGWGVRELSAVAALSAIGVPKEGALLVALLIGTVSILAAFFLTAISTVGPVNKIRTTAASPHTDRLTARDLLLPQIIPVVAAVLIFFQVNLPTKSTLINVNLADPILILGGLISVFAMSQRRFPQWRISGMNLHFIACTLAMTLALLIGAHSIGWTEWALANKYLGWFVLMATALTGAMAANIGLEKILRTFVVAGCAVIVFQYGSNLLQIFGIIKTSPTVGFTQNSNAFAFQCIMVLCAALALPGRRTLFVAIALTGLWLALSRAGLIAGIVVVLVASVYIRGVFISIVLALCIAALATISLLLVSGYSAGLFTGGGAGPFTGGGAGLFTGGGLQAIDKLTFSRADSSIAEHLLSMTGAVRMFTENPLFGGGLGVYIEQWKGSNALVIHSTPLWLLGEFGLVGLLIFFAPIARIAGVELPRFRSNDMAGNFTVLIIVALGVMSLFHELLYQRTFWFLLGAALIPRQQESEVGQPTAQIRA